MLHAARDLGERHEHKPPLRDSRVRNLQLRRVHNARTKEQNVDVDRARVFYPRLD